MLLKSFELLEAFREHPNGLTYSELIRLYPKISKVSIFRILCSLEQIGYLETAPETNRYVLGAKFVELGRLAERRLDLLYVATPMLQGLLEKFNENVNLISIKNFELVYLKTLESTHPLRVQEMPNRRNAVYCSAAGKAILAFMEKDQIAHYLETTELVPLTRSTITRPDELRKELEAIRRQGYAMDNEENLSGVRCVAAPIINAKGLPIAAVSISGPSTRITAKQAPQMARVIKGTCDEISARCNTLSLASGF